MSLSESQEEQEEEEEQQEQQEPPTKIYQNSDIIEIEIFMI